MKINRKPFQYIRLFLFFWFLISCSNSSSLHQSPTYSAHSSPSAEKEILSNEDGLAIRFACPEYLISEFTILANQFHMQYPMISIKIISTESISKGQSEQYIWDLVSNADTLYYNIDPLSAAKGMFLSLSSLIDADPTFQREDFFPRTVESFMWNDNYYALPSQITLAFLLYDKDIFDKKNVQYPMVDWTKNEFFDAALLLTSTVSGNVEQYGFVDYGGLGKNIFIDLFFDNSIQQQQLDTDEAISSMRWYTNLDLKYHIMPSYLQGDDALTYENQLITGKRAAMWSDFLPNLKNYQQTRNIGLIPFPTDDDALVPAYMYGYAISAGTAHPKESWYWISFLSNQWLNGPNGEKRFELPSRISVAESKHYWDQFEGNTSDVVRYASAHMFFPQFNPALPYLVIRNAEKEIRMAAKPVELALSDAQLTYAEQIDQLSNLEPVRISVSSEEQPTVGENREHIYFSAFGHEKEIMQDLATAYNGDNESIEVKVTDPSNNEVPDCYLDNNISDSARNLVPLIEEDDHLFTDAFFPNTLNMFRYQDDLFGLPLQVQARVLFYNPDIFDMAGIPYPTSNWTISDFLSASIQLTGERDNEMQYGFLSLNGETNDLLIFISLQGVKLWDETGFPRFDQIDVVNAAQWYFDLAFKYGVMPIFKNRYSENDPISFEDRTALIRNSQVAMWTDFVGIDRASVWPNANIRAIPLPYGSEKVTDYYYTGLFISEMTSHEDACWEWIKYVSSNSSLFEGLPVRQDLFYSQVYKNKLETTEYEAYKIILEEYQDLGVFTHINWSQMPILNEAVADILGGLPVETALYNAQRKTEN